jgi:L-lysine 2,3-aminomutase
MPIIPDTDVSQYAVTRGRFDNKRVASLLTGILGTETFSRLRKAKVDGRMMFGSNPYYLSLAMGGGLRDSSGDLVLPPMPPSQALLALILPKVEETTDLTGEKDPSNQLRYSPPTSKGRLIHKYDEVVLAHCAVACSAHCRYCFRLDLFNKSTGKALADPEEITHYIETYNATLISIYPPSESINPRHRITEVLLSGGDPLILTNAGLHSYLVAAARATINLIRIGTKELAFRPHRIDRDFTNMLRIFHTDYPEVHLVFVVHFTHPDEFLERGDDNSYLRDDHGYYRWLSGVSTALALLHDLPFVTIENQTPIIAGVNDNSQALHLLHEELRRKGVRSKYTLQCRDIEGHSSFAVPIETAWQIHNDSQRGLSDEARSRLVMSTEWGKLEIVSVLDDACTAVLPNSSYSGRADVPGLVVFKLYRSPSTAIDQGALLITRRNPSARWITGYTDRIVYDGRHEANRASTSQTA